MRKCDHVLSFALEHPWAITPAMRRIVAGILASRLAGEDTDPQQIAALNRRENLPQPGKGGGIAIIPVYGVIAPRVNLLSDISGGTTFETLSLQLADAVANPNVSTIVFDVDSPGGNVAGAHEFASDVLKARTRKPIIAVAQYLMASAAYWALSGATEIVAAASAQVGSIGVYTIHEDISEALAKEGIKQTIISAGKYKAEGIDGPLSDDARQHIASLVDLHYERFTADVGLGRGVKAAAVRSGFGEGRTVAAPMALEAGMVDRIGTLADTITRLRGTVQPPSPLSDRATSQEQPPLAATLQERASDVTWQAAATRDLLALEI